MTSGGHCFGVPFPLNSKNKKKNYSDCSPTDTWLTHMMHLLMPSHQLPWCQISCDDISSCMFGGKSYHKPIKGPTLLNRVNFSTPISRVVGNTCCPASFALSTLSGASSFIFKDILKRCSDLVQRYYSFCRIKRTSFRVYFCLTYS